MNDNMSKTEIKAEKMRMEFKMDKDKETVKKVRIVFMKDNDEVAVKMDVGLLMIIRNATDQIIGQQEKAGSEPKIAGYL